MKPFVFSILTCLVLPIFLKAQTTVTLQPTPAQGKDAEVFSCIPCGYDTKNYGTKKDFNAFAWTNGGNLTMVRSLIQFDLSFIPANALISSAQLSLYFNSTSPEGYHSGTNASYLQKIIAPWGETTVTWNNQPATTTTNQVLLPTSSSNTQNYLNINVTNLISDMALNPATNYGFMIKLVDETIMKKMIFASSDHVTATMRPKLVITYTTPLPIELSSFEVKNNFDENQLTWTTATEINNAGFEIERSLLKEIRFEKIGTVAGHGNSSQLHRYDFEDIHIASGVGYLYRLKQIDFDGHFTYSEIIEAKSIKSQFQIVAGPNPFRENTTLYYNLDRVSVVKIEAFNLSGMLMQTLADENQAMGNHKVLFDPRSLGFAPGVYEIRIVIDGQVTSQRLIYLN